LRERSEGIWGRGSGADRGLAEDHRGRVRSRPAQAAATAPRDGRLLPRCRRAAASLDAVCRAAHRDPDGEGERERALWNVDPPALPESAQRDGLPGGIGADGFRWRWHAALAPDRGAGVERSKNSRYRRGIRGRDPRDQEGPPPLRLAHELSVGCPSGSDRRKLPKLPIPNGERMKCTRMPRCRFAFESGCTPGRGLTSPWNQRGCVLFLGWEIISIDGQREFNRVRGRCLQGAILTHGSLSRF